MGRVEQYGRAVVVVSAVSFTEAAAKLTEYLPYQRIRSTPGTGSVV